MLEKPEKILPSEAQKVKALLEAGFTQAQLAKEFGVAWRTVHRWLAENKTPHPRAVRSIDELFKEHVDLIPYIERLRKPAPDPIETLKSKNALCERVFVLVTYHSNAIEGSRMMIKETQAALEGKPVRGRCPSRSLRR